MLFQNKESIRLKNCYPKTEKFTFHGLQGVKILKKDNISEHFADRL